MRHGRNELRNCALGMITSTTKNIFKGINYRTSFRIMGPCSVHLLTGKYSIRMQKSVDHSEKTNTLRSSTNDEKKDFLLRSERNSPDANINFFYCCVLVRSSSS